MASTVYFCLSWLICMVLSEGSFSKSKSPLNDFIDHYETLNYAAKPKVFRRAIEPRLERTHTLDFNAHGRTFKLNLRPDTTTLAPGARIVDGAGNRIEFDQDSLSVGEIIDEPGSQVHGVLRDDGTFTGKIYSKDGVFFVESAKKYFEKPTDFHSVIYKDEDVKYEVKFAKPKVAPVQTENEINEEKILLEEPKDRQRRAASGGAYENNICLLSMEADYTFLEMAKEAVLAVGEILKHVQALNIIYGHTFNTSETYKPYSIQFQVGFIQVYEKDQTPEDMRAQNIDISTFLNIMTRKDYSKFCEAVYFTHRNFEGGILGLAWIGYPRGRAGGMCDPRRGSKSYNTAVVTFTLHGKNSPPKVSEITFAHEVGHSFGAEHDDDRCTPGGYDGNYIMYDKATSGDRKRNDHFSECSVNQIKANVDAKRSRVIDPNAEVRPRLCLESRQRMLSRGNDLCGNGVIEGDEQCDCGPEAYCKFLEPGRCCNWDTCKLNRGKVCSPSQGPCCNSTTCEPVTNATVCEQGSDCLKEAKCPANDTLRLTRNYKCPDQEPYDNGKECAGGARLCHDGLCSRSLCSKYGLTPCECKKREEKCQVCCKVGDVCLSADKTEQMKNMTPYFYGVGTPCANNTGYCDIFHYCQRVDMEGPLLRLFNLYFTSEGVKELTRKYWLAILFGTAGLVGIVVLLVIFGARYTESDNPEIGERSPHKPLPRLCCRSSSGSEDRTNAMELRGTRSEEREDAML